jgi:TolB protein
MRILLLLFLFILPCRAGAVDFDIYQSGYHPLEMALMFDAKEASKSNLRLFYNVVKNDLASSQSFRVLDPLSFLATPEEAWQKVEYGDWRIIGAEILAMCQLRAAGKGWQVVMQVHDLFRAKELASLEIRQSAPSVRALAHRVADRIYSAALGIPGYFSSHLLYVEKRGKYSDLVYMDQDGANRQVIGRNFTLLLSPDWSPDGRKVVLNTYVGNHPRLEFFDLGTGKRTPFGEFDGLNSTPEFSPDGRYVAATLSYTGNADIHIYDIKKKTWRAFTGHRGIDTSPAWSPDGRQIAFVSNRSGKPQVYRKALSGGRAHLVSTRGVYNTSPAWSPDGSRIAMISKKDWNFAVATIRPDGSDIRYLATGKSLESPSWSPNGQMLLFSSEEHGIRRVYRVPSWGGRVEPITSPTIDASDAAWSRR